jgi:hypothetical protein
MPGGYDKHQRFIPETVTPVGRVHYEELPVAVQLTIVVSRPSMERATDAWVLAWTQNAVFVLWLEVRTDGKHLRTRWVPPNRVMRLGPQNEG